MATTTIDDATLLSKAACRAADSLGLKRREFALTLGVSEPTISRLKNGQSHLQEGKSRELALMLIRVYRASFSLLGGDRQLIKQWLQTPNKHLNQRTPMQMLQGIEGMTLLLRYLDTFCDA
jgi:uncharacterized protein (DUF2384 family)